MKLFQWIPHFCVILVSWLACSCVDVREEFWIHEDGSAEAEITCQMPRAATFALGGPERTEAYLEELLSKEDCIDSYEIRLSEQDERVTLKVHCTADRLASFDQMRQTIENREDLNPAIRKMVGDFDIGLEGLAYVSIKRRVAPGEAVPALRWLPKAKMANHRIVKIIHFPQPVTDHNAHETWDKGHTLMWESSLASAIQTPLVYQFVMPLPIPWAWIAAAVLSLVAVIVCGVLLIKKRRLTKLKSAPAD